MKRIFIGLFLLFTIVSAFAQEDFNRLIITATDKVTSGDFQAALDDYNKIIVEYPNYTVVYFYRGNLRFRMGAYNEAIADYTKAISRDSSKVEVFFYRAICKTELNDYKGALEDLNYVISKDPNFGDAYVKRGEVKIALNQKASGCADIQKALDLGEEKAKSSMEKLCND